MTRLLLRCRLLWAVLIGTARLETARCGTLVLDLLDLRRRQGGEGPDLRPVLEEALRRLSLAGDGFGELVTSHLQTIVVAADLPTRVLHKEKVFVWRLAEGELMDGHHLACLLVWAAVSGRLARDQEAHRTKPDLEAIRTAAQNAQLRFIRHFSDWEYWADTLGLPY